MPGKKKPTIPAHLFWLASLLFFISGGTGLAYQVIWFKRFSHVWGSSSLAFAAVGGSFLFGLGLGAYLLGQRADRAALPLRWYGLCELLIGVWALVIPFEIGALVNVSVGLYAGIPEQPLLRFLVQFSITLLVIGPPCVLMGGTLPLLIRQLTPREGSLDQATGWLYAINTFGAAAGCYLAGFHLIAALGLLWTNNLTALVNIAIGLVSLLVSRAVEPRSESQPVRPAPSKRRQDPRPAVALAPLFAATVLSGCAALILEMTWSRQLALVLGGSTYAFTATLFVVLVGIASGSLVFHGALRRAANSPILPLVVIGLLVAGTLAGRWLLPELALAVAPESIHQRRGDPFWNGLICVGTSAALELVPAMAMGILFPLFVHLTHQSAARVGAAVGNIYAWNTLGSIAGASLTAVVLFPRIGTSGALTLALAFYVVALLAVIPWRSASDRVRVGVVAATGAAAVAAMAVPTDPRLTNAGMYMYGGPKAFTAGLVPDDRWIETITPLYFREGASSNVFVSNSRQSIVSLRVNGKVDANNGADMDTQLGLAYFPRMFKPDAKDVLVIGFGSGCTSGTSLLFPDTRVTCCEIEPAVYGATEYFADINHRPQEKSRAWLAARNAELPAGGRRSPEQIEADARFSIVFGDGRTVIQGSDKKFDLIISEPSNPWLAGVSNLFTQEFFRAARDHLNDDGVLAQWIQTYQFTLDDYLMIVRTLRSEFPHCGVIEFSNGNDTVLLASKQPLLPSASGLAALQKIVDATPEIVADLEKWYGRTDLASLLVQHYLLDEEQLDRLLARQESHDLNTDLHLRLEFDAPLHLFRKLSPLERATTLLFAGVDPKWIERLANRIGIPSESARFHLLMGEHELHRFTNPRIAPKGKSPGEADGGAVHFQMAIKLDPNLADAYRGLARLRLLQGRAPDAVAALGEVVRLKPLDAKAHADLAQLLNKQKQNAQAVPHFREALRLKPEISHSDGTVAWANNLAWILATSPDAELRDGAEAVRLAKRACEIESFREPTLLDTYAAALAEAGRFDEAIKVSEQIIDLSADRPNAIETAKARIELYKSSQPYREP